MGKSRYPMQLDPPKLREIEELIIWDIAEGRRTTNQDSGEQYEYTNG